MKIVFTLGFAVALSLGGCSALQSKQSEPLAQACMSSRDQALFAADRWQQRSNLAVGRGEFPSLVDVTTTVEDASPGCDGGPALVLQRFSDHPWLSDAAVPRLVRLFRNTTTKARREYRQYQKAVRD